MDSPNLKERVNPSKPTNATGKVCPKCRGEIDWKVVLTPRLQRTYRCHDCATLLAYEKKRNLTICWELATFLVIALYVVSIKYVALFDNSIAIILIGSAFIGFVSEILSFFYKRRHLALVEIVD
ncbi:hypothetical protein A3765_10845 [Oleiphilus sp. HI0130]|nr:hypothetical protein A3750_14265 [Oleiphilus sp. HI0079]KZZ74961.1 hypothetical protein A3765_10845 [Oleiphilus sp. HI0130]